MSGKEVIYRVTFENGETCHTGYRPLAEVWAKRSGAVLEEIGLEVPTEQHEATFRWRLLPQLALEHHVQQTRPIHRTSKMLDEIKRTLAP